MGIEDRGPLDGALLFTQLGSESLARMALAERRPPDRKTMRVAARYRFMVFATFLTAFTALSIIQQRTWAPTVFNLTGLFLDIAGGSGLAIGVLRIEEQPVGQAIRRQTSWSCKTFGFATEEGKFFARRQEIFRYGRLVIAGFILQAVGTSLHWVLQT